MAGSEGIDRRTLIKGAAVAGAAAWTAPMIVDSLASPAAAASPAGSVQCSKSLVFFRKAGDTTTIYATGYQNSCLGCGCFGTFSGSNLSPGPPLYFTFSGLKFRVDAGQTNVHWNTTCALLASNPIAVVAENSPTCNTYLTVNSATGTVSPAGGSTVIGGIGFEAGTTRGFNAAGGTVVFSADCITGGVPGSASCA